MGKWKVRIAKPRKRQPKEQSHATLYDKSMDVFILAKTKNVFNFPLLDPLIKIGLRPVSY
jgi:hypothetical protein